MSSEVRPGLLSSAIVRGALVVVLAFAAFHGPHLAARYQPDTWLFADGSFYFTTLRSLVEHGRLEQKDLQPRSWYEQDLKWNRRLTDDWSNVALGRNGGWYPKHPILVPVAAIPLYLLYGPIGTLALNVLMNLAFLLLAYKLATRFAHPGIAAFVVALAAAVPFVREMSYSFSNDLLGTILLLGALELSFAKRFGLAGVLAGLSLWSRVTHAAFLPGLVIVAWDQGGWKGVRRAILFACIPLGVWAALNTWQFGAPWTTSYQRVIVRENGVAKTASHARLFNVPFLDGMRRILFGADGGPRTFPLLVPGLVGLVVLMFRRRLVAAGLLLFCVLPLLAFAKYDWYRAHFLYPVYGVGAVGLAALLGFVPRFAPQENAPVARPSRTVRLLLATGAVVAVLGSSVAVRAAHRRDPQLLSSHLEQARVFLDDIPCDYFNPQHDRYECSSWDKGVSWNMTGRVLGEPVLVRGAPRRGLWMHPNPSRKVRRMVFDELPARRVELTFALGDQTHEGPVDIELLVRGAAVDRFTLRAPGEEATRTVELVEGPGPALEVRVRSNQPDWKHLVFEGRLYDR